MKLTEQGLSIPNFKCNHASHVTITIVLGSTEIPPK